MFHSRHVRGESPKRRSTGGPTAVILSHGLCSERWRQSSRLNSTVLVRGEPHTIVGIMPASFAETFRWRICGRRSRGAAQGRGRPNFIALLRVKGNAEAVEAELNQAYNSLGFKLPEGVRVCTASRR